MDTNHQYSQEIDYTSEADNAEKFASNFKNMDYVKIPTIFWEYTTPQVWHCDTVKPREGKHLLHVLIFMLKDLLWL